MSAVGHSSFKGYWVEPFLAIVIGKHKIEEYSIFKRYATTLYDHRVGGNTFENNTLDDMEHREIAIEELYRRYLDLDGNSNLQERASLLSTVFMETIRSNNGCPLNEEEKEYVNNQSIPGALQVYHAEGILDFSDFRGWLQDYRQGCSKPEVIRTHFDLFSGYTDEEKKALVQKRQVASGTWYPAYKEGLVSKEDLQNLVEAFKKQESNPEIVGEILQNNYMKTAYQAYQEHEKDFSAEKKQAYWGAIIKALETFIQKAV